VVRLLKALPYRLVFLAFVSAFFWFSSLPAWCEEEETKSREKASPQKESIEEQISRTDHAVTVEHNKLMYSATAGEIIVNQQDSDVKARMFYVAYEVKTDGRRPITFAFNGGPGAASVWLHLGCMGPQRVDLTDDGRPLPPPATYSENPYTWLAFTDLVFIDPVGTGFSRSIPDTQEARREFFGVEQDIQAVGEFIRLYLTRKDRWLSPTFLVGESYGTTRAAGLSKYLQQRYGIDLTGLVLISPVLDFDTIIFPAGHDLPYALFLPTYAATNRYYQHQGKKQPDEDLRAALKTVETFCLREYMSLLARGDTLSDSERHQLGEQLAAFTGLSENMIVKHNYRIAWSDFTMSFLKGENRVLGRMDTTISGAAADPTAPYPQYDPSLDPLYGVFSAAMNAYVRTDLAFETDRVYEFLNEDVSRKWDWESKGRRNQGYLTVADRLHDALAINEHLHVFVAGGMYDLATPYFATRYTLDHLWLGPLKDRVVSKTYRAGHMMFTHADTLKALFADVQAFYEQADR